MKPLISTYVSGIKEAQKAVESGVSHLIIEDERCSLKMMTKQENSIEEMIQFIQSKTPQIHYSLLVDRPIHIHDQKEIVNIVRQSCQYQNKLVVRYCDLGLPQLCQSQKQGLRFHFMPASGYELEDNLRCVLSNNQTESITLTNEITYPSMQSYKEELIKIFEVQVHGHVLLQHSGRHLLSQGEGTVRMWARSETHQKKIFPCVDNRHGHFMYFWAQRCLMPFLDRLYTLRLQSWLIDVRGEPSDYKEVVWSTYSSVLQDFINGVNISKSQLKEKKEKIENHSRYPLHKGFFDANNTNVTTKIHHRRRAVKGFGKVVSLLSRWVVVKLEKRLRVGDQVTILTTEGLKKELFINKMRSLDNSFIQLSPQDGYVLLPRCKGVSVGAILVDCINQRV